MKKLKMFKVVIYEENSMVVMIKAKDASQAGVYALKKYANADILMDENTAEVSAKVL